MNFLKKSPLWTPWAFGTALGMLLGIAGFLSLLGYGANNGCFLWIDQMTGMRGYESCGYFGGFFGVFSGVLLGVFVLDRLLKVRRPEVGWIALVLAWVIPLAYGLAMGGLDRGITLAFLAFFMLIASLSSAFLVLSFKS